MADPAPLLVRVLADIQRRGGIGSQPIEDALAHSRRFLAVCPAGAQVAADLGSGGGLPALVIAVGRPELEMHLVERRATRADLLRRAVTALDLASRVHVHAEDVTAFARRGVGPDLVTARSFGPRSRTLAAAADVLGSRGWILISDPPTPSPAPADLLASWSLVDRGSRENISRYERVT
jgi:16S rRNA (guanine527-N7)-methyltransferase